MNRLNITEKISNLIVMNPNLTAGFVSLVSEEVNMSELERIYIKLINISEQIENLVSSKN